MSETEIPQEKARRWSAYVCPECRFVFRVPSDHDGVGIICPSCRRMLRIPQKGEETAPLMAPLKKIEFFDEEAAKEAEKRTRGKRKKKQQENEQMSWDASSGSWRSSRNKGKKVALSLIVWIGAMAAIVGLIALVMKFTDPKKVDEEVTFTPAEVDQFDELVASPLIIPEEELDDEIELPKVMKKSESEFLAAAEPMAKAFLDATHTDEILPLIHDSKRVASLIAAYYPTGKIEPIGMSKFNTAGQVSYKDSFAAVGILTPDFEKKQLAFIDGENGLKIDWESWVGWSEIPWDELKEERPGKATLVRAMVKWVDYYNFGFADDKAWRSYRLVSPDGEIVLYGYVERNSLLDQRLRPSEQASTVAVTLKIHFREDEQAPNQVLIDEYVADGWVVPKATK